MAKKHMVYEVRYNEDQDTFETWLAVEDHEPTEDDFGLECSCKCVNSATDQTGKEPELIHFSILKRIARASALGYKIVWKI